MSTYLHKAKTLVAANATDISPLPYRVFGLSFIVPSNRLIRRALRLVSSRTSDHANKSNAGHLTVMPAFLFFPFR